MKKVVVIKNVYAIKKMKTILWKAEGVLRLIENVFLVYHVLASKPSKTLKNTKNVLRKMFCVVTDETLDYKRVVESEMRPLVEGKHIKDKMHQPFNLTDKETMLRS